MGVDNPRGGQRWGTVSPVTVDRILLGACAAVWLAVVGVSVAAVVALVDLGRSFQRTGSPHTPGVLYAVIIVSALVIVAAIPVLLRARRTGRAQPARGPRVREAVRRPARPGYVAPRTIADEARTERLTALAAAGISGAEADRIWLRGTLALAATMGVALIAVAAATYLMAIGRYGPSWTAYGIAGIVTATMPLISWHRVRRLRRLLTRV